MPQSVEVLVDKHAGDIGLNVTDENGTDVEVALSLERAWDLVAELTTGIQKLKPELLSTTRSGKNGHKMTVNINVTGALDEDLVRKAVRVAWAEIARKPQVQDAVREAIGADQHRPRYVAPGAPRTIPIGDFREEHLK